MNHNLIANLETLDLVANGVNDAGRIGPCDMVGLLMDIKGGNRLAQRRPDTIVIDTGCHYENEDVMAVQFRRIDNFNLHGGFRFAMTLTPNRPSVHFSRDMAERWNFSDLIQILDFTCRCFIISVGQRGSLRI